MPKEMSGSVKRFSTYKRKSLLVPALPPLNIYILIIGWDCGHQKLEFKFLSDHWSDLDDLLGVCA